MGWKLKRVKQCVKCPWKTSTDPNEIPHGYSEQLHRNLAGTIAQPGGVPSLSGPLRIMGCHEHPPGADAHCVGWLMHQLGPGNNILLRMSIRDCDNIEDVELDGPQHDRFEDTLPEADKDRQGRRRAGLSFDRRNGR